jgi:hypothetical protein
MNVIAKYMYNKFYMIQGNEYGIMDILIWYSI